MNKLYLACMVAFLISEGIAIVQGQETLPTPTPLTAQELPADLTIVDGLKSTFLTESGAPRPAVAAANAEYLIWFLAGPRDSMPLASTGLLGSPGTVVLGSLGDADRNSKRPAAGGRFTVAYWQIQDNAWVPGGIRDLGAEAVFFFVAQRSAGFNIGSASNLGRPFFDLNDQTESRFLVAGPGLATGSVAARVEAEVWGAEANLWKNVYCNYPGTTGSLSVMAGFRFLDYHARLNIGSVSVFNQDLTNFPSFLPFAGSTLQVFDAFSTHNWFYGGQIGVNGKWWPEEWIQLEMGMKLGLGATSEDLTITGFQVHTRPDGTRTTTPAGLLALPSNIGNYHRNVFAQVPELDAKVAVPVFHHVTLSTGFTALYWSKILRPALQIDRDLDITQIPNFPASASAHPTGLMKPGVPFKQSDLVLLGLSLGFGVNW
jgi:hypothetical protein